MARAGEELLLLTILHGYLHQKTPCRFLPQGVFYWYSDMSIMALVVLFATFLLLRVVGRDRRTEQPGFQQFA